MNSSLQTGSVHQMGTGKRNGTKKFGSRVLKTNLRSALTSSNENPTEASNHVASHNTLPNILSRDSNRVFSPLKNMSPLPSVLEIVTTPSMLNKRRSSAFSPQPNRNEHKIPTPREISGFPTIESEKGSFVRRALSILHD